MKIGIIGNGILGSTLAHRLSKFDSNIDIHVFGDPTRANSASMAAAAMFNSFAEIDSLSEKSELDDEKFNLSQKSARLWPVFIETLIEDSGVTELGKSFRLGTFVINNSAADSLDDANFDSILEALKSHNEPHSIVDVSTIPNYSPMQHARAQRAVYIPREGWVNPKLVLFALDAYLKKRNNVRLRSVLVNSVQKNKSGNFRYLLQDGTDEEFDICVVANGTSMNELQLNENFGLSIQKLFYGVGTTIEIESEFQHENCIRTPNRGLACGIYSAPYLNHLTNRNNIVVGASNFISNERHIHSRLTSVRTLLSSAEEQINKNFYRANLVNINIGWRPTSQDTYPLIGRTKEKHLFVLNGTKRDGFHFSPLIAENIAQQILNSNFPDVFQSFSPDREILRFGTRESGIENAIKHRMSAAHQHGYHPSTTRMDDLVVEAWRLDLNQIYDHAGIHDFSIPPEMLDMYRYGHAKVR
jgi:glycine oxidase